MLRVVEWFVPVDNAAGAVYGVILIGALLAAESKRHETYLEAESSALIAAAVFWLAHAYATVLGWRLGVGARLSARAVGRALAQDWNLMTGAAIPLLVLPLAWLIGGALGPWELALDITVGAGLGLAILALKIVLH